MYLCYDTNFSAPRAKCCSKRMLLGSKKRTSHRSGKTFVEAIRRLEMCGSSLYGVHTIDQCAPFSSIQDQQDRYFTVFEGAALVPTCNITRKCPTRYHEDLSTSPHP